MAKKPAKPSGETKPVVIEGEAVEVTAPPGQDAGGKDAGHASEPAAKPARKAASKPKSKPASEPKPKPKPEPKPEPAPETEAKSARPADEPPTGGRRGASGALLLVAGGALAAIIGFASARYVVPEGWPFPGVTPEPDPLVLALDAQKDEIAALKTGLAALGQKLDAVQAESSSTKESVATLEAALPGITERLDALEQAAKALDTRVLALEKMPLGESAAAAERAAQAYQRELTAMREMFAAELKRIEDEQKQAVAKGETAEAAAGRAALAKVLAAIDEGEPFADALTDLQVATDQPVPDSLATAAKTGVPTLSALQASFPEAARAAIEAETRAAVDAGEMNKLTAFLKLQVRARSLEPREGDDADAVLSRAEGALKQGDLAAALAELSNLPEAAKPAMQGWIDKAEARRAAIEAVQALAQSVNGG